MAGEDTKPREKKLGWFERMRSKAERDEWESALVETPFGVMRRGDIPETLGGVAKERADSSFDSPEEKMQRRLNEARLGLIGAQTDKASRDDDSCGAGGITPNTIVNTHEAILRELVARAIAEEADKLTPRLRPDGTPVPAARRGQGAREAAKGVVLSRKKMEAILAEADEQIRRRYGVDMDRLRGQPADAWFRLAPPRPSSLDMEPDEEQ